MTEIDSIIEFEIKKNSQDEVYNIFMQIKHT